ncbi:MAG: DUF1028 domain-containing protein [Ignavibacteria bacterium]|nr:MAG: DUF1028 domain-containing protein [Ignavibacteria bacterium]
MRLLIILFFLSNILVAQLKVYKDNFAHTFSIVAIDKNTGEMGVAVQSHWFSVGSIVSWGEAGVGVVATQSFVNPSYGTEGLKLLKKGLSPQEALDSLLKMDEGRDVRQVAILDAKGRVAAWTGKNCIEYAGHITGDGFSVQANLMKTNRVWPAMAESFEKSSGPLAERLIAALEAAQAEGGDIRGKQSAAILIVNPKATGKPWIDKPIDLRVEDSVHPIKELKRLLKVYRAYEHMNNGDLAVEKGDNELAMKEYSAAEEMFPDNLEMKYWHAVTLVNIGELEKALPLFKEIFSKDQNWKELTPRLLKNNLLNADSLSLKKIMEQ